MSIFSYRVEHDWSKYISGIAFSSCRDHLFDVQEGASRRCHVDRVHGAADCDCPGRIDAMLADPQILSSLCKSTAPIIGTHVPAFFPCVGGVWIGNHTRCHLPHVGVCVVSAVAPSVFRAVGDNYLCPKIRKNRPNVQIMTRAPTFMEMCESAGLL